MPTALITGASAGIGRAIALELARHNFDLIVTARREPELRTLATEIESLGRTCQVISADLADPATPEKLWATARAAGPIEVLVANAGFGLFGPFHQADPARLLALVQVNIVAVTHLTRLALPDLLAQNSGRVLLVSSMAAFLPGPGMAAYYASKAFVKSLGEALAYEVRTSRVTVTTLCPGPVQTEFAQSARMTNTALFNGPGVMAADAVAAAAVRGLLRGQRTVLPGWRNRLGAFATRFAPTSVLLRAAAAVQARKSPAIQE